MSQQLGDGPIEKQYQDIMHEMARDLDYIFNGELRGADRQTGFVLLVFPYNEADCGRCSFLSNGANRSDLVCLFKEMIARFEGQPGVEGHA